jgi:hypothetical protein
MKSDYQKEQEAARKRQERREKRAERRIRRALKQEAVSLLDKMALAGAQEKIQDTLEAERDEFLERDWYVRAGKAKLRGYRNGYAKPRQIHLAGGSVEVEAPWVSEDGGDFRSGLLASYQRTSPKMLETLPQLYLYGISTGDFEAALECLLGVGAALSPSTISRLKEKWAEEYEAWRKRPLASHYAYIWADGIYIKVGRNKERLALLVVMGADVDGRKQLLTLIAGQRESEEQWWEVLHDLKERGVTASSTMKCNTWEASWTKGAILSGYARMLSTRVARRVAPACDERCTLAADPAWLVERSDRGPKANRTLTIMSPLGRGEQDRGIGIRVRRRNRCTGQSWKGDRRRTREYCRAVVGTKGRSGDRLLATPRQL